MDLDMLAPYISMDDDFQLTVISSLPEEADKPSPEPPAVTHTVTVSRKRYDRPVSRIVRSIRMSLATSLWSLERT